MEDETCYCPYLHLSTFWRTKNSTVPHNIIEFEQSFGYNVKKLFNLVLIDPDVLVFASGNILHFFRISTNEVTFRRSADGGGIGFITKNPNRKYNYLTVGENGNNPRIIIYEFPTLNVISELIGGAKSSFTCLSYNPDGELLASQAGEPDYMLTIWDWKSSTILLRTQSFQNDVINVVFSPYNPTLLTTCGLGHIKFWKMAKTFTGLKLLGELGRFGKTEFSDIYVIYPLEDEKVISGCEWGNMLVWDGGLISLEVCRKNRQPCHKGPITYINMNNGEVTTAGMDGFVRIWFWETIEVADPPDDDRVVEVEPINEFRIAPIKSPSVEIRTLIRMNPENKNDNTYYIQDGVGGIWFCDLNVDTTPEKPRQIFQSHAGRIESIAVSPISTHFATLCSGGKMHFYNYETRKLEFIKGFSSAGSDLVWLLTTIDPSGSVIIAGFRDGVLRQIVVNLNERDNTKQRCFLIDAIKSHGAPITKLTINPNESIIVSGSEEQTIFIYQLVKTKPYVKIVPIGFIALPSIPNCFNWKPERFSTILVGCSTGEAIECDLPEQPRGYTEASYNLHHIEIKQFTFRSVKSEIRRKIFLEESEKKKIEKRKAKVEELKKLREANPGIEINEEQFLAESDSEDEHHLEPLYIPKIPNPILWLRYTPAQTVWLSMGGYDAGYLYECVLDGKSTTTINKLIDGADDIEIHSFLEYGRYLIFGMQNGIIRVNAINPKNFRDLSDYWTLSMHDNHNGIIPKICKSYDGRHLFSIGYDNNIFSYKWNGANVEKFPSVPVVKPTETPTEVEDIDDINVLSLEQQKLRNEYDRRLKLSSERKQKIVDIITDYKLKFREIARRNKAMPLPQQLSSKELELDERITEDLANSLDEELQLVRRKLAYDIEKSSLARKKVMGYFIDPLENLGFEVFGIRKNVSVKSVRAGKLDEDFINTIEAMRDLTGRTRQSGKVIPAIIEEQSSEEASNEFVFDDSFLLGYQLKLSQKMVRILDRYRKRQTERHDRDIEWKLFKMQKPDINKNQDEDIVAIREAEESIGDYKLKSHPEYDPSDTESAPTKFRALLLFREELFYIRNEYNKKILKIRAEKKNLYHLANEKMERIAFIQNWIPVGHRKSIVALPKINEDIEYPEKNLMPQVKVVDLSEVRDLLFQTPNESHYQALPSPEEHTGATIIAPENIFEQLEWKIINPTVSVEIPTFSAIHGILENYPEIFASNTQLLQDLNSQSAPTPWAEQLRYKIIFDKITEQNEIVSAMECRIESFDEKVELLRNSFERNDLDSKLMEERLMTINQELYILHNYEQTESKIYHEVYDAIEVKHALSNAIASAKEIVDDNSKTIEKLSGQIKALENNYMNSIKGNKFYDFLRKIFKKRYKPTKEEPRGDESEESSESEMTSTSEEEDAGGQSEDSLDFAPIRFDENFCPPGCDKRLYDMAFSLRGERHVLEQSQYSHLKSLESRRKEIENMKRNLANAEEVYKQKRHKHMLFKRERQKELNKIKILVILKMDQLQYVKEGDDVRNLTDTLLFNMENVKQLYIRVGQLNQETLETKRRHRINIVHHHRMQADLNFMSRKTASIQKTVNDVMFKKFAMVVDLDELDQTVLRKFVFQKKVALIEETAIFEKSLNIKKKALSDAEYELMQQVQVYTEKINILTVLQEEKNFLTELLYHQAKLYEKSEKEQPHLDFRKDITKLHDILCRQEEQIEMLEKEITTLRLRSKPLQSPPHVEEEPQNEELLDVLPSPYQEETYEKIAYENFTENQPSTSLGIHPDPMSGEKITKIVKKFLVKSIGDHATEDNIRKYTKKIADYFGLVARNFDCDQAEEVFECIVENFQTMVPDKYLTLIKPNNIKDLFNEILEVFDYEKAKVSTDEVLDAIIANSVEACESVNTLNYTQELISHIFREIIEVLSMNELSDPKNVQVIYKGLRCISDFNPKCISLDHLMEDVVNHAREMLLDEFDFRLVRNIADEIIKLLLGFRARLMKPEKPME